MFYVNQRWLGGLLTNYATIQKSVRRLKDLEAMKEDGRYELLPKKEVLRLERERTSLDKNLSGIKNMPGLPDAIFIIDSRREEIAVAEARRLKIPVLAVVDTNCDPEPIDHVIPGNDDALRAIRLFASRIADSILEGQQMGAKNRATPRAEAQAAPATGSAPDAGAGDAAAPAGGETAEAAAPVATATAGGQAETSTPEMAPDDTTATT
jgi:small subunit ribosomal protein S2